MFRPKISFMGLFLELRGCRTRGRIAWRASSWWLPRIGRWRRRPSRRLGTPETSVGSVVPSKRPLSGVKFSCPVLLWIRRTVRRLWPWWLSVIFVRTLSFVCPKWRVLMLTRKRRARRSSLKRLLVRLCLVVRRPLQSIIWVKTGWLSEFLRSRFVARFYMKPQFSSWSDYWLLRL